MLRSGCSVLIGLVLWVAAGTAPAQVTYFGIFYTGYSRQVDENPPTQFDDFYFSSQFVYTNPDDVSEVRLRPPGFSDDLVMQPVDTTGVYYGSAAYPTAEDLNAAFSEGPYEFTVDGGSLGAQTARIERFGQFYPPVPYVTDATYRALQGFDPSQDFTVRFNTFELPPEADVAVTFLIVYSGDPLSYVFAESVLQPANEIVLPAGTAQPNAPVFMYLYHSCRNQDVGLGFDGARSDVAFDHVTTVQGYAGEGTPMCPADFNMDGGIDGGDVESFFAAWENGDASADVNFDGGIDGGDVETFFFAWENGGCG